MTIILGGLLLDAAMKDAEWENRLNTLMERISRDQDRKAFAGWTFRGGAADGWATEPKIEQHLYGCAGRWNAKTHSCKSGWVPLQAQ